MYDIPNKIPPSFERRKKTEILESDIVEIKGTSIDENIETPRFKISTYFTGGAAVKFLNPDDNNYYLASINIDLKFICINGIDEHVREINFESELERDLLEFAKKEKEKHDYLWNHPAKPCNIQ